MNTWLYLTAEGLNTASTDWPSCLWSSAGQRRLMPLNQAAREFGGQTVDLLLPMELCSWVRTDPWPNKRHPGGQAIAFAVENQLSDPLDHLHLGFGSRDKEGCYPVMVVERARFAAVLALLEETGITVRSVYVDADIMPGTGPLAVRWFAEGRLAFDARGRALVRDARIEDGAAWISPAPDPSAAGDD